MHTKNKEPVPVYVRTSCDAFLLRCWREIVCDIAAAAAAAAATSVVRKNRATISNVHAGSWVVQVFLLSGRDSTMRRRKENKFPLWDEMGRSKIWYKIFETKHVSKTWLFRHFKSTPTCEGKSCGAENRSPFFVERGFTLVLFWAVFLNDEAAKPQQGKVPERIAAGIMQLHEPIWHNAARWEQKPSGKCKIEGTCLSSPHFPKPYGRNETCEASLPPFSVIRIVNFSTENKSDYLTINGYKFWGKCDGCNCCFVVKHFVDFWRIESNEGRYATIATTAGMEDLCGKAAFLF